MALNPSMPNAVFDRTLLVARRERAAPHARQHDFLLTRVADDFTERLGLVKREFGLAANVGAHHGVLSRRIRPLPNVGLVIDTDHAPAMLAQCDGPHLCADEEALPFADGSLDLIVSALSLQFVNDLPGALLQIRRALKSDGLFLGAVLGGETLKELREAFLAAETELDGSVSPRVAPFASVRQLGQLLGRAGFALPVADSDSVKVAFTSPLALMQDVKGMGASNMLVARSRRPMTRRLFARALQIYAERFARPDGRVVATFEIITLTAWVPHDNQQKPLKPGSARKSLAEALAPRSTSQEG